MDRSQTTNLFRTEPTMAAQPRDSDKPKTKTEKGAPETVLLTPEELRAISGGLTTPPTGTGVPPSPPKPKTVTKI
jgi:hypothetical protein